MSEDSKIIDLFYARDEQAIALLSEKYGRFCERLSKNILKSEKDAEECVNDAYLAAWNTIPPQNPKPLSTYIFRIVRNISIAKYHANTSVKRNSYYDVALSELENCIADPSDVENEAEANVLSELINSFLGTLDRDSRMMFVGRYWCSYDLVDIAVMFGTNSHNVSVRLSRIRKKLKNYLTKEGFEI